MSEELKENGVVTFLSTIGIVFGIIGMLASFIPCLGVFAIRIAIPASLVSGVAVIIAYLKKTKITFAIIALTFGLIGTTIAIYQAQQIASFTNSLNEGMAQHRVNR